MFVRPHATNGKFRYSRKAMRLSSMSVRATCVRREPSARRGTRNYCRVHRPSKRSKGENKALSDALAARTDGRIHGTDVCLEDYGFHDTDNLALRRNAQRVTGFGRGLCLAPIAFSPLHPISSAACVCFSRHLRSTQARQFRIDQQLLQLRHAGPAVAAGFQARGNLRSGLEPLLANRCAYRVAPHAEA
jgi:hypothetical protein